MKFSETKNMDIPKNTNLHKLVFLFLLIVPFKSYASFIESTLGTAVVNDATATYFNPAALVLVKNPQLIGLGSTAGFHNTFNGQAIQSGSGFIQSGRSSEQTNYYLPSLYFSMPATEKIKLGFAVVGNSFERDLDQTAILRYVEASNQIQDVDFVPAIGIKINDFFSIGAGLNFSRVNFILKPVTGIPSLNIPDSQSLNESSGTSVGGDAGLLFKVSPTTLLGYNYRSNITYHLSGNSFFEGSPPITSNQYHFTFWTPARHVLSINHFFTSRIGVIGTIQYIQWNIIKNVNFHNIATQIASQSVIIPNATVNYHLHNAWLFTLGGQYRATSQWVIRAAGTYNQTPGNANYQISQGDSIILGASTGYEFTKNMILDGSFAHVFFKNQNIHITTARNIINGVNKSFINAVSLKLTINIR